MTHLDYNLDTTMWIGIPDDVGVDGGASADEWAAWVVGLYAEELPPTDDERDLWLEALTVLADERDEDETRIIFAPQVWGPVSAISVRAGLLDEPLRPADIAGVEVTDDVERYVDEITSEGLGRGIRFRRFIDDGDEGVLGVLVYAFVQGDLAVRVSSSDYDLNRLALMVPFVDEFVDAVRVVEEEVEA